MKVYNECCKNCLLSPDRIVSGKRALEIVKSCVKDQTHFICHKASLEGKDVCCHSFYKNFGHHSKLARAAKILGVLQFIPQPDAEKLPTFKEMNA